MSDSEAKLEWFFVNLRWFFLLTVAGIVGLTAIHSDTPFPAGVLALLVVGAVANLMVVIALLHNNPSKGLLRILLALDVLLTLGFIASGEGAESQLLFVSLIPITTAAVRISRLSGILLVACIVLAYWGITWNRLGLEQPFSLEGMLASSFPDISNGLILALAGGAVSQIGARIQQSLIQERERMDREAHTALETAHQKARLIFELASTLSATLNYERVLEAALDVSNAGLKEFISDREPVTQIGMILLFGLDQSLYIAKARGLFSKDEAVRFPTREGVLARAVAGADPLTIDDPATDPELQRIAAMHNCQQAVVVPLRAGFESYGMLVLGSSEPDVYTQDFQDLLVAICNQAVMALQNANLYQNLMEDKDRLVTVEEDARKKLARDLHDGPTQTIAAIAMRLNYVRLLVARSPEEATDELRQLEELARKTTKEIRQMLFTLRPLILESQGLIPALEQLRQKIGETDPLNIHLEVRSDAEAQLSKEAQGSVFYIIEEATTNARKHAGAENLWIRLFRRGGVVLAEIEDDGVGFDVAAVEANYASRSSLGLLNLQERSKLVGGKTVIQSVPGKGTKITVTIPIQAREAKGQH